MLCPNVKSLSNCGPEEREKARSLLLSRLNDIPLPEGKENLNYIYVQWAAKLTQNDSLFV